jgi:2-polyprenyl-3-methyl-5-hydroxy-6-metoxy-1,4-benzoquinol methylase
MLKNDETFWTPSDEGDAIRLSWGNSDGDAAALWNHSRERWSRILEKLRHAGLPEPRGKILEFGSGMGHLDELLGEECSSLVMLDHTDAYIRGRSLPLSARCRHLPWKARTLELLEPEAGSFDWLVAIAVFYHVDTATAAALILELGRLLEPGGHVLIEGWRTARPDVVRSIATRDRLFTPYPHYVLELDLLRDTLAPEFEELCREGVLLYRKASLLT